MSGTGSARINSSALPHRFHFFFLSEVVLSVFERDCGVFVRVGGNVRTARRERENREQIFVCGVRKRRTDGGVAATPRGDGTARVAHDVQRRL